MYCVHVYHCCDLLRSTYRQLSCAECTAALGKMYLTTPAALDFLRDRYSLAFAAVTSYVSAQLSLFLAFPCTVSVASAYLHISFFLLKRKRN